MTAPLGRAGPATLKLTAQVGRFAGGPGRRRLLRTCRAAIGAIVLLASSTMAAGPGMLSSTALAADASAGPAGYSQLSAWWWRWALQQPSATNPLLDRSGADCGHRQYAAAWFLAGTLDGSPTTRSCTVPAGRRLFFPVINAFSCGDPGSTSTYAQQQELALRNLAATRSRVVVLDGARLAGSVVHYTRSKRFSLTLGSSNVYNAPAGTYQPCADAGYYVLLPAPRPGHHTLRFAALAPDGPPAQDVQYELTIG